VGLKIMRWKVKKVDFPDDGDIRIVEKYLLFPKKIKDEKRWLENATILQRFRLTPENEFGRGYWEDVKFIN
jgi:hypothetical protein